MIVLEILFFLGIGFEHIGLFHLPYQEILIGLCAVIIGAVKLVNFLRNGG